MLDLSTLTDIELVELCLERGIKDERPYHELFQRHHIFVSRVLFSYSFSSQDVEDLTQDIFFNAYRKLNQFEKRSSFKTWIFSISSNTAKNELRKRSIRPKLIEDSIDELDEILSAGQGSIGQQISDQHHVYKKAFSLVDKKTREILLLKESEELTYREIASRLNISESAAKMRVQRSRLAVRKQYLEIIDEH